MFVFRFFYKKFFTQRRSVAEILKPRCVFKLWSVLSGNRRTLTCQTFRKKLELIRNKNELGFRPVIRERAKIAAAPRRRFLYLSMKIKTPQFNSVGPHFPLTFAPSRRARFRDRAFKSCCFYLRPSTIFTQPLKAKLLFFFPSSALEVKLLPSKLPGVVHNILACQMDSGSHLTKKKKKEREK